MRGTILTITISLLMTLSTPAYADDCDAVLGACNQAVIELVEVRDAQAELIKEQARQLDEVESSGGGWQWEWFALGLAAGMAGALSLR